MSGPQVHITNGIPDVGTGNVLTLDQVVYAQGASLTTGGGVTGTPGPLQGPLAQGAATTSAPTYTTGTANPLSLDTAGNLRTSVNNTVAVTGTFWQATQPVSGTVSVSGTVTVSGTVAATQSGTWNINNISGTITLPSGAATAAKQPALGTAGTASLDVLTVQGITSMVPLKVDGSATTQPISGNVGISGNVNCVQVTSPWVTSISGSVTCVQSGNWTSRCVGNVGGIFDFSSVQNVATPAQAILIGGEFNAVPTTITTGNSSPLQLNSSGSLRVDGSGVTQPVSGTVTARLNDGTGNAITSTSGALDINIKSGGGSGGTSSSVAGAVPATGTLAMGRVTTAAPTYTTATADALSLDTAGNLRVNVVTGGAGGGAVYGPTAVGSAAANPPVLIAGTANATATGNVQVAKVSATGVLSVDGSSVTQPVSGTFWQATQPVSGTVTSNQGGAPWTVKPDGTAWAMTSTSANVNVTNASIAVTGTFWQSTQPVSAASLPLPSGAATATNQTNVQGVIGNATAPASMIVTGGVYNSAKPTLTTGQSAAIQVNSSGIQLVDGTGGTFVVTQATASNLNATVSIAPSQVVGLSTGANEIGYVRIRGGNSGLAPDFNGQNSSLVNTPAILIGGQFNTSPTTITSGNGSPLQLDNAGNLKVSTPANVITGTTWNNATTINTTLSIPNNPTILGQVTTTSTITAGALTFEESYDNGTNWVSVPAGRLTNPATGAQLANPYTLVASTNQPFQVVSTGTTQMRVRLSTAITGTGSASFVLTSSPLINEAQVFQNNAANLLTTAVCAGDVASGATDSGSPQKIGGRAATTNPTAVSDGQRVNGMFDKVGKQVCVGAVRALKGVQKTSITVNTETTVVTATASIFNDVYAIIATNKSATGVSVDFKDSTGGTTRVTLYIPPTDTRGFTVPVDSAIPQATVNTNWTATVSSAVTSIEITMLYVQNT